MTQKGIQLRLISHEFVDLPEGESGVFAVPGRLIGNAPTQSLERIDGIRVDGPFTGYHLVFGDENSRFCVLTRQEEAKLLFFDDLKAPEGSPVVRPTVTQLRNVIGHP